MGEGKKHASVEAGMMETARWATVALIQNGVWRCDELAWMNYDTSLLDQGGSHRGANGLG